MWKTYPDVATAVKDRHWNRDHTFKEIVMMVEKSEQAVCREINYLTKIGVLKREEYKCNETQRQKIIMYHKVS